MRQRVIGGLALICLLVLAYWIKGPSNDQGLVGDIDTTVSSIAVLPFDTYGEESEDLVNFVLVALAPAALCLFVEKPMPC